MSTNLLDAFWRAINQVFWTIAQLAERRAVNSDVPGSSPGGPAQLLVKEHNMATPKTPKPKMGNGATTRATDGRRK